MARINFELKGGIHTRFIRQCDKDGRKPSDVLRSLILDWEEKRVREERELELHGEDDDGR